MKEFNKQSAKRMLPTVLVLALIVYLFWPRADRELIGEVDTTWTMHSRHANLFPRVDDVIDDLDGIYLELSTFDVESKLEFNTYVSSSEILRPIEQKIADRTPSDKFGTKPHTAFEDALNRATHSHAEKILVFIMTDGDTDGSDDEARVAKAARELAAMTRVKGVMVCGLKPGDPRTTRYETLLAPLRSKLVLDTGVASQAAVQQFVSYGR